MKIALLGGGTVGSEVVRLIESGASDFTARIGQPIELVGVAVRDASRERPGIPRGLITTDAHALVSDSGADVVVELMGGIEPARELILSAISGGASVVSANKALLASHGAELTSAADAAGVDLFYEAAVAGAIPLLRPLRESLSGDKITRVLGIVNGTTNYMLTKMSEGEADFHEVLAEAQRLGYAEADPTADVEGHDSAAKAAILASLAFHTRVTMDDVYCEGITGITAADMAMAADLGFTIKLLAIAELADDSSGVIARVHPAMVPLSHPLANVRDSFNAVFVEAEAAGQMMFYGRGAGGGPTASAVLGDLVAACRNRVLHSRTQSGSTYSGLPARDIGLATTGYAVSIEVDDQPGVLATIASVFAAHEVSIEAVRQEGARETARLVVRTHRALESALSATVSELGELPAVNRIGSVLRVEGEGAA